MKNKLAIVIVNYNDYDTTKQLLDNIKDYSCLNKIVIVDNNSTDNSYQKLQKLETDKINIIRNNKSKSYASGLNLGAKYLIKKFKNINIIFSNSDIIIKSEKDLIKLSSDIGKFNIGVIGPVINEHGTLNRGWMLPNANQEILFNLPLISRYFKKKYLSYNPSHYNEKISIVGAVSGCFFIVNSNLLKEINYFDENTFLYYEENILAKKVEKTSYQIAIDNEVEIIHNHSVTIDKAQTKVNKYKILKNSQRYYVKEYLNANKLQLFILYITNKLSLLILYIRCIFKK